MHAARCTLLKSSAALLRCSRSVISCHTPGVERTCEVGPVYDTDLARIIKDKEAETRKKAPLFGATTVREARDGAIWAAIGKAWRGLAGTTAFRAYRKRFPNKDNAFVARYDDSTKEAVLRGDHDALLKRAMARCHMKGLDIWTYGYKFVALDVSARTINTRLKELDATRHKKTWRAELRARWTAEEEFGGERFLDDEGVENVSSRSASARARTRTCTTPTPACCAASPRTATTSSWSRSRPTTSATGSPGARRRTRRGDGGGEGAAARAGAAETPPEPRTRAAGRRREEAPEMRQPGQGLRRTPSAGAAARGRRAERPNDVERDDESWARWAPFIDVAEGDARASAVCRDALRAASAATRWTSPK